MLTINASRRKVQPRSTPRTENPSHVSPVEPALFRLVKAIQELSRVSRGGDPPADVVGDGFDGHDEDENHVYYWLNLPDYDGPDVDLNLHGKTLMIRFDKSEQNT
ncbi:MAG: hypothetical protein AB7I30_05265 [Isosphaeraceae bacterium]